MPFGVSLRICQLQGRLHRPSTRFASTVTGMAHKRDSAGRQLHSGFLDNNAPASKDQLALVLLNWHLPEMTLSLWDKGEHCSTSSCRTWTATLQHTHSNPATLLQQAFIYAPMVAPTGSLTSLRLARQQHLSAGRSIVPRSSRGTWILCGLMCSSFTSRMGPRGAPEVCRILRRLP